MTDQPRLSERLEMALDSSGDKWSNNLTYEGWSSLYSAVLAALPELQAIEDRLETSEAREERLTAALRPFAEYADLNDIEDDGPDDAVEVPTRDLANARAALAEPQEAQ